MNIKRTFRFSIIKCMRFWNRPWQPRFQHIFGDIKFILEPLKKSPTSVDEQRGTEKDDNQTKRRKYAEPKYDPSKDKKKAACQKWENPKEIIKLLMEAVAILLAISAGCIYFWQAAEAKRQAMAAEGQLREMQVQWRLDERAWMAPDTGNEPIL